MRIGFVADIHGNQTASEAVLKNIQRRSPDRVVHGGDLCDSCGAGAAVLDRIRELQWEGVAGNTDQMLFAPDSLRRFAAQSAAPRALWQAVQDIADATRESLGEERLAWLANLPHTWTCGDRTLVHAKPGDLWQAPDPDSEDAAFDPYTAPVNIFAHIHRPFSRRLPGGRVVANTGSVGLSYDGDSRASYLLIEGGTVEICRVEYDVERAVRELQASGLPQSEWVAAMLRTARPALPPKLP